MSSSKAALTFAASRVQLRRRRVELTTASFSHLRLAAARRQRSFSSGFPQTLDNRMHRLYRAGVPMLRALPVN
jgi:Flp pilus assembly protein TadB